MLALLLAALVFALASTASPAAGAHIVDRQAYLDFVRSNTAAARPPTRRRDASPPRSEALSRPGLGVASVALAATAAPASGKLL
ncbi:hypothetical protein H696_06314 [Fonticula alba]|uniref:Uncharacterized protein n=1 Tax=Fonticula alba TaxID=691883 RepID=A0A058YZ48_FONAL|nr:hypothetical protein H696_06314 [Fonticula alba]KCV67264.1 hypothetical protein H696_06314 [Fonticula alba]|eukprot:XP_009498331.1 hypothetical protein H696_06314 [Fonticula alba]